MTIIIDDFSTDQASIRTTGAPSSNAGVQDGSGILGGERDIQVAVSVAPSFGSPAAEANVFGGELILESGGTTTITVSYDGDDNFATNYNPVGLGGIDLTAGGRLDGVYLRGVDFDLLDRVSVEFDSSVSSFSGLVFPVSTANQDIFLPFSAFAIGLGAGADFTNVGAIQLRFEGTSFDVILSSFEIGSQLSASLQDIVQIDADSSGTASAGDTVRYTAVIQNPNDYANYDATGVAFTVPDIPNATLVVGSVTTTQGTITTGNTGGDTTPSVAIGTLADNGSVTVTFDVVLDAGVIAPLSVQGTVTSDQNTFGILTDDPGAAGSDNPTVTPVTETPSLIVTTTADVVDNTDGLTSLREAVARANFSSDQSDITFDATVFAGGQTITLSSVLDLSTEMSINGDIDGDGKSDVTLDGNDTTGFFDVGFIGQSTLEALTLINGRSSFGGIEITAGDLTIIGTTIRDSVASTGSGGAINVDGSGSLILRDSAISGNSALNLGGGIYLSGTTVEITNTTFSGNFAGNSNAGAGVHTSGFGADLVMTNSTITGNLGKGLFVGGSTGSVTLTNNIILGNTGDNIDGVTADATNIVTGNAADVFAALDINGGGVLADNGGAVQTVALLASAANPALDVGVSALLLDANGNDRTVDLPGVGGNGANVVDAGAVELQALGALTVSVSPASIPEAGGSATGTVTRSGDTSTALVVTLSSSDTTEATVPGTVTIAAGAASASFTVTAIDDGILDGDQPVTITATGAAINPGASQLTVTENRAPTITLDPATLTLPEDTDVTSRVKVADVVIADDGIGTNTLTLRGPDAGAFELIGTEVFIRAGANLDFELEDELNIFVDVDDPTLGTNRDDTEEFVLRLTDVNEAPSVALANALTALPEDTDTTARVKVADIVVTDDALGSETLALAGADAALFEIDGTELFLKAGTALDFETDAGFEVSVTVNDTTVGTTPDDTAALAIAVTDVNEAPSVALFNVTAGQPETPFLTSRLKVADIVISDDALGSETLSLSGADALAFEIDGLELYLKAGRAFDFETTPALTVSVDVNDATIPGAPDGSAPLIFPILDVNEAPSLALANVRAGVAEDTDTTSRVKIADIVISDDAPGTNTLAVSGADATLFEIEGLELFLKAGTALDFETDPQLDVTVTLDDPDFAGLEGSAAVTLAVTDADEPPMVALSAVLTDLPEDADTAARIKVADIVLTDDALGSNTLGLTGADAALFEIDGLELYLIAGAALDFETNPALDVTVTVNPLDPEGTAEDMADLTLAILDVNEAPSLTLVNVTTDLAEDTDTTTPVKIADIVISDDALGSNTLAVAGADAGLFEINGLELVLKAGVVLDFETAPQLDVTVTLDDPDLAGLDGSEAVVLAITDVNELPTVALLGVVSDLAEDTDTSARVKVADIDVTDDALGTATLGLAGADAALFEIDGTELYLKAGTLLDFETKASLDVAVTVDDPALGAGPEDSAALTVAVTDVNEAPDLALANVVTDLAEDADTTARLKVADIVISDDALGTNTLALAGDDADLFEIDGAELYLKAGTVLDFEGAPQLDVTVTLDDPDFAGLEGSQALALMISNANEPPAVTLSNAVTDLAEDTDTTTRIKIADITVSDDGLGTQTLGLAGADADLFEIDGTELYLKAGSVLDFETKASLDVSVTVDDPALGTGPEDSDELTIAITDVNEAPSLEGMQDVAVLTEGSDTTARTAVATLTILDDALGTNVLSLSGEDGDLFELEGTTLFLKAGVVLDGAANPVLDVTVELDDADLGAGPEAGIALAIDVADTNQTGTSGNDLLIGTPFEDMLFGLEGDDTLVGRNSDDLLDGDAGDDVAVFQAPQTSYTITLSPGGITVADRTPDGTGTDTLIDIETLRFSSDPVGAPESGTDLDLTLFDGVLEVSPAQLDALTHLYIGLFDRAPDALGLLYWATQLEGGLSFDAITQAFIDSPEAIAIYGAAPSNAEIVEKAYENLFDRSSEPTGAAFWTGLLDQSLITPASFFELFVQGAALNPDAAGDRQTLADQVDIGLYFALIKGLSNVPNAATALDAYDLTDRSTSLQEAQDLIDTYATSAMSTGDTAELIVQVTGILDDPFAMV